MPGWTLFKSNYTALLADHADKIVRSAILDLAEPLKAIADGAARTPASEAARMIGAVSGVRDVGPWADR